MDLAWRSGEIGGKSNIRTPRGIIILEKDDCTRVYIVFLYMVHTGDI